LQVSRPLQAGWGILVPIAATVALMLAAPVVARACDRGLFDHKGGKGRRVRVTTDPSQGQRDRHGRLLAYVASARRGFATAQLRAGWASVSVSGKPFKRLAAFQAAEASARKASRGIWAQCGGNVHTPAVR
jgi:endonuclease YncB( thermonuclease family)